MNIKIGTRLVGDGQAAYLIAELSANHGGKIELAIESIKAAKRAGADAIKLQTYKPSTITLNCDGPDFKLNSGSPWFKCNTLWHLYEIAHTPWEWHKELFRVARDEGLEIFSSPFDESSVDFLNELGVNAFKIASPEITHIPLLRKVAHTNKPIILSTGLANFEDIELAIATIRQNGNSDVILLKCTTAYPAPYSEINLRTMADYKQKFGVVVGLSDHTIGSSIPIAAVALGAKVVEKHFMISNTLETPDSFFSIDEIQYSQMVSDIRNVEAAIGAIEYKISDSSMINIGGRRSIYVSSDVEKGDVISTDNIICVRPGYGLHPKYFEEIIGKRFIRAMKYGDRMTLDAVDGES